MRYRGDGNGLHEGTTRGDTGSVIDRRERGDTSNRDVKGDGTGRHLRPYKGAEPAGRNVYFNFSIALLSKAKQRMIRGDMVETYKILTRKLKVDPGCFFEKNTNERTRGPSLKLVKKGVSHQARAQFFSQRIVSPWNRLPEEVVSAPSINSFKNRLHQHWTTRDPLQLSSL